MTKKDYAEMTAEELEAEVEARKKAKTVATLEAEDNLKLEAEELLKLEEQKNAWKEEFYKENPKFAPVEKIPLPGGETKSVGNSKLVELYKNYQERFLNKAEDFETNSHYKTDFANAQGNNFQIYRNQRWEETGIGDLFSNTDSDASCPDTLTAWSPADTYARVVWETFVCKMDLFKLAVKGIAINPGDGLGVQIRAFGAFGAPSSLGACECATCGSISFTTYPLTLKQLNLEAIVCDKDIWDVGSVLMDSYLIAMANSWAQYFDAQIYSELETATPGTTETLGTAVACSPSIAGSCCTDTALTELYNAVHAIIATMREATIPYNPDYLILSPTVAAIFKRMQTPSPMPWMGDVTFDADGRLSKMGGIKVVEYCGANSCTNLSSEVVAIIIDSRRAVGAVWGEQPKLYKEFQSNCNSYRIDQWAYFAVGELDTGAIAHIVNP